ncbi:MAG: DeoR/GlpR transcriptional regulator [Clostridia bacterium]|nr:DeoR/GlpR transcriptional regulator [Clostridia bacterium]
MVERRQKITALVNEKGMITFQELTHAFPQVSEMTLRKDLKYLDETQQIVRIYGGARSLDTVVGADVPLKHRMTQNMDKKRQIAQKARELVQPGAAVFLDSGSTCTELARVFPDVQSLVFTGGLNCLNELSRLKSPEIHVLGGVMNKDSLSVRDPRIARDMSSVNLTCAFISANGYTREQGFTCRSETRREMEQAVISRADKVVVLMDSQKVGSVSTFTICGAEEIDVLVSDDQLDPQVRCELEAAGVLVL